MKFAEFITEQKNTHMTHIEDRVIYGGSATNVDVSGEGFTYQLGRTIDGTSDVFTLACLATTNNDDAAGSVTWQELSN